MGNKFNYVIRLTGSRTAKVKRFGDQGIFIAEDEE